MKTEAIIVNTDSVARLIEVPLPPLTDTRVKVQTLVGGVSCGTEGDCANGRATYMQRPLIMGYQAVGKVTDVGDKVIGFSRGDLVVTKGGGLWDMTHLAGGSHARESISEAADLVKLKSPDTSLPSASYSMLGAIGWECIARMKLEPGRVLLIFGLGMLGQLAGRIAQILGLRVIGINRSADKREAARDFGFDGVATMELEAIQKEIKRLGFGPARFALDTTGSQEVIDLAISSLSQNSELSLGGYCPPGKYQIDLDFCHGARNLSLHNPVGPGNFLEKTVGLVEDGRLTVDSLIRTVVRPSEITAFYSDLMNRKPGILGAIIDWRE